jgi:hypothetical protein
MCKKCGKCCHRGDFWWISPNELIRRFANSNIDHREEGSCRMLSGNKCLIEKYLGRDAKPEVCKEYDCEEGE